MKLRTLAILALLVAALALFVVFVEKDLPSSDERQEHAERVLELESEEVVSLTWSWGGAPVVLRRSDAGDEEGAEPDWWLVEPYGAAADAAGVSSLVATLAGWRAQSQLGDADRSELGLADPRLVLRIGSAGGETTVRIGAELPVGDAMVVEVEGRQPVVVADAVWSELAKAPGEWRSRLLVRAARSDIEALEVAGNEGSVRLASRDGVFHVTQPFEDVADADRVGDLLSRLTGLRAESFVDDEAAIAAAGLDPPAASVDVELAAGEPGLRVEVGAPLEGGGSGVYARVGGQVAVVSEDLLEATKGSPDAWRSLAWTQLERWKLERVVLREGTQVLSLEKSDFEWQRDGKALEYGPVEDLLSALTSLRADGVLEGPPAAGEPSLAIELTDSEGEVERLELQVDDRGGALASDRRPVVLRASGTALDELREAIEAVRRATPKAEEKTSENQGDATD